MRNTLLSLVLIVGAANALADNIPIYPFTSSIEEHVSHDGYALPQSKLPSVDFGGGLELPLPLNFSSQIRPTSTELGQGWSVPLFDSKIYDQNQRFKRVQLLGGKEIALIREGKTNQWKHFYTDDWTGEEKDSEFILTHKGGSEFHFKEGKISELKTPSGRVIEWKRQGEKLAALQERGQSPALTLEYNRHGFVETMKYQPKSMDEAEQVLKFTTSLVYAGVQSIEFSDGRIIGYHQGRDEQNRPHIKITDTKNLPQMITWDAVSGRILEDNQWKYSFKDKNKESKAMPTMFRQHKTTSKKEHYSHDVKKGITTHLTADGTLRKTYWMVAPGPNYKMVRMIEETPRGGKTRTVLRRAFDKAGNLTLESHGLASGKEMVKRYLYNEAGQVTKYFLNDQMMWENVYDAESGKLIARQLGENGTKMLFEHNDQGEVLRKWNTPDGREKTAKITPDDWSDLQAVLVK